MREFPLGASARLSEQSCNVEGTAPIPGRSAPLQRLAYSVRDASYVSGLSRATLYLLMQKGKLASIRVGGRRLIRHEALVALLGGEGE